MELAIRPLTPETWGDFEELFGPRGACGGCWCMWWRLSKREFDAQKGEENRRAMKTLIEGGAVPGIIAYDRGRPVGWCAVAPREQYPRLERTRLFKRFNSVPVWSIVCLFVRKRYRRLGISTRLLETAVEFARAKGGTIVEGYPVVPAKEKIPDLYGYHGFLSAFQEAGFREVARPSQTRRLVRYEIESR
jgi:GNAT superfamily N-acetyltransferase